MAKASVSDFLGVLGQVAIGGLQGKQQAQTEYDQQQQQDLENKRAQQQLDQNENYRQQSLQQAKDRLTADDLNRTRDRAYRYADSLRAHLTPETIGYYHRTGTLPGFTDEINHAMDVAMGRTHPADWAPHFPVLESGADLTSVGGAGATTGAPAPGGAPGAPAGPPELGATAQQVRDYNAANGPGATPESVRFYGPGGPGGPPAGQPFPMAALLPSMGGQPSPLAQPGAPLGQGLTFPSAIPPVPPLFPPGAAPAPGQPPPAARQPGAASPTARGAGSPDNRTQLQALLQAGPPQLAKEPYESDRQFNARQQQAERAYRDQVGTLRRAVADDTRATAEADRTKAMAARGPATEHNRAVQTYRQLLREYAGWAKLSPESQRPMLAALRQAAVAAGVDASGLKADTVNAKANTTAQDRLKVQKERDSARDAAMDKRLRAQSYSKLLGIVTGPGWAKKDADERRLITGLLTSAARDAGRPLPPGADQILQRSATVDLKKGGKVDSLDHSFLGVARRDLSARDPSLAPGQSGDLRNPPGSARYNEITQKLDEIAKRTGEDRSRLYQSVGLPAPPIPTKPAPAKPVPTAPARPQQTGKGVGGTVPGSPEWQARLHALRSQPGAVMRQPAARPSSLTPQTAWSWMEQHNVPMDRRNAFMRAHWPQTYGGQ